MSYLVTPELSISELPERSHCLTISPQPDWFVSPFAHHYTPRKPSPLASPARSNYSLSDSYSDGVSSDDDSSSSQSSCGSPTTPLTPTSPWSNTPRRASESDYFSLPSRKVRFASLDFSPELNVPYRKPEGPITPLWRLEEIDESDGEQLPTLKLSFKSMKASREKALPLPLHSPPAPTVPKMLVKRPSLTEYPLLRVATLRRNSAILAKQFTAAPIPRRHRTLSTLVGCVTLFVFLLVISSIEQARYQAKVFDMTAASAETHAANARPVFFRHFHRASRAMPMGMPEQAPVEAVSVEPFHMSEQDELAALISFMTGTVANILPLLNAEKPLDPQNILPFDPSSTSAQREMDEIVLETWEQHPLLILGHMRDPLMVQTKRLLQTYRISPAPEYIEIDQRGDAEHVESILTRLLGVKVEEKPLILLAGSVMGSNQELYDLHKSGDLAGRVARVGIKMAPLMKKAKHAVFEERSELDRIRKPSVQDD